MDSQKPTISFGQTIREYHFNFDKLYTPLNHGSFGTFPKCVRDRQCALQDLAEARPDTYLRYTYPELLVASRRAIAPLLGVDADEVVFVPNATTGVNTVLRNLVFEKGDVILCFSTVYGACKKSIDSVCETTHAERACITIQYPIEDEEIVLRFNETVQRLAEEGKKVKIAMFDTVITFPGVRFPWEMLVKVCKELGVLSLIDGAHAIGHIDLTSLGEVAPDFFTSNCYKWLYVPRGCAVFYVPIRNQHLIHTSLPTSWGYQSQKLESLSPNLFVELFNKVSTVDTTPYVCVPEALRFRELVCGSEATIREYCEHIAQVGGKRVAEILGTEIMDSKTHSFSQCCFVNVRLPLTVSQGQYLSGLEAAALRMQELRQISEDDAPHVAKWITERSVKDYDTMIPTKFYAGAIWCRLSGQIYLELKDFEWAAYQLKEMCDRVLKGEFKVKLEHV